MLLLDLRGNQPDRQLTGGWVTYFSKLAQLTVLFPRDFQTRGSRSPNGVHGFLWFVSDFLATWIKLSASRANEDGNNPIILSGEERLACRNRRRFIPSLIRTRRVQGPGQGADLGTTLQLVGKHRGIFLETEGSNQ